MIKHKLITIALLLSLAFPTLGWAPIDFDGTDDFVNCGNPASLQITGTLTINAWVKAADWTQNGMFVAKYSHATGRLYYLAVIADRGRFVVNSSGGGAGNVTRNSSGVLTDGAWHMLTGVYVPSSNLDIYVDGQLDNGALIGGIPAAIWDSVSPLYLGSRESTVLAFDGIIADAAVWNTDLSADQIEGLYNSKMKHMPLQIEAGNLVAYWPMDDGPDGTSADGDTVKDLSGSGSGGTGDDGAGNDNLTWTAETVLTYP